jgi:hypothetical protein
VLCACCRGEGLGTEVKRRILMGTYALSAGYYDAYYKRAQQVRIHMALRALSSACVALTCWQWWGSGCAEQGCAGSGRWADASGDKAGRNTKAASRITNTMAFLHVHKLSRAHNTIA